MKNILILDCGCTNFGRGGSLNHAFSQYAADTLTGLGHQVKITQVESPWVPELEAEKIRWADVIIVQTPGWWMGAPWQLKKYEDQVFIQKGVCGTDGRHMDNPTKNYGRGGILTDKKYMISSTWNAPKEAFSDPAEFFEGRGIDGVFFPLHKAFQFLGMKPLPSFMANDVVKNPQIEADKARWIAHLTEVFKGM
jgi:modulator of drug activity B